MAFSRGCSSSTHEPSTVGIVTARAEPLSMAEAASASEGARRQSMHGLRCDRVVGGASHHPGTECTGAGRGRGSSGATILRSRGRGAFTARLQLPGKEARRRSEPSSTVHDSLLASRSHLAKRGPARASCTASRLPARACSCRPSAWPPPSPLSFCSESSNRLVRLLRCAALGRVVAVSRPAAAPRAAVAQRSSTIVTGPSLTSSSSIRAPNTPVSTGTPRRRNA
jgi:hypothetical protein